MSPPLPASPTSSPPPLPLGVRAMLGLYGLAWRMALPGLRRNKRLREGWAQRTLAAGPPPKADLWIQAASGGEAYLAWELLSRLPDLLPQGCAPTVLATTFTTQGLGVLERAREALAGRLELMPAYFPFDLPGRMERALSAVAPKAVVLLETELWPGLLAACRGQNVPALVLNARMTDKSLRGYQRLPGFWRPLAPQRVLAVSDQDAARFAALFPDADTGVMPNIKFDRLAFAPAPPGEALAALLPEASAAPFLVLASVRREEEEDVLSLIKGLRQRRPEAVIGLFPRHMARLDAWSRRLVAAGIPLVRRSAGEKARPGSLILWDVFGELQQALGLARAAFVGGSLAELGGQNFLEPLAVGVTPVIGPSWSNFAWVGREIFDAGLVRQAADWRGVLEKLCALIAQTPDRDAVRAAAADYASARKGGAAAACQVVAQCLDCG